MIESIGEIAGKVWGYLDQNGETSMANLKKNVDVKGDLIPMALGWLARENKIKFVEQGRTVKVQLKQIEVALHS